MTAWRLICKAIPGNRRSVEMSRQLSVQWTNAAFILWSSKAKKKIKEIDFSGNLHTNTVNSAHYAKNVLDSTHVNPVSIASECFCLSFMQNDGAPVSLGIGGINLPPICANIRTWHPSIIHFLLLCQCQPKSISPWKQPSGSTRGCWFQQPPWL